MVDMQLVRKGRNWDRLRLRPEAGGRRDRLPVGAIYDCKFSVLRGVRSPRVECGGGRDGSSTRRRARDGRRAIRGACSRGDGAILVAPVAAHVPVASGVQCHFGATAAAGVCHATPVEPLPVLVPCSRPPTRWPTNQNYAATFGRKFRAKAGGGGWAMRRGLADDT